MNPRQRPKKQRPTNDSIICIQRIHVCPHLVWDSRLKPCLLPRSLREPRPNRGNVQNAQVLEKNRATPAKSLNNKVVEKVVCGFRKIIRKNSRDVDWISNDCRDDRNNAGGNRRD